ncbi:MAG: hypothetical protein ACO2ZZ_04285 [Cyclobacteriaceae bacterium]
MSVVLILIADRIGYINLNRSKKRYALSPKLIGEQLHEKIVIGAMLRFRRSNQYYFL